MQGSKFTPKQPQSKKTRVVWSLIDAKQSSGRLWLPLTTKKRRCVLNTTYIITEKQERGGIIPSSEFPLLSSSCWRQLQFFLTGMTGGRNKQFLKARWVHEHLFISSPKCDTYGILTQQYNGFLFLSCTYTGIIFFLDRTVELLLLFLIF